MKSYLDLMKLIIVKTGIVFTLSFETLKSHETYYSGHIRDHIGVV